jgi:hypothetical protein
MHAHGSLAARLKAYDMIYIYFLEAKKYKLIEFLQENSRPNKENFNFIYKKLQGMII